MRTLIYVPIIHTGADLGSMAKEVIKAGIASLGEGIWAEHRKTVEGFWDAVSRYFDSLDVKNVKIYQDGLVVNGEVGRKIVEETAEAGSRNYQLVSRLLQRGAFLVTTEDFNLVKREYNDLLAITRARSTVSKIIAVVKYKLAKRRLLNKRDKFIANSIDQTLAPNEKAILFIGASHKIRKRLPGDITITELKDIEKVRKYQKLLPFHDKYSERFWRLARYLVSDINLETGRMSPDLQRSKCGILNGLVGFEDGSLERPTSKPILLIEDDVADAMTTECVLKDFGLTNQLVRVANGREALEYLRSGKGGKPCLVLLDLNMSKMDGLDFLKAAKADNILKNIPVVVLTRSGERHDVREGLKLGVVGHIIKPVDCEKLMNVVKIIDRGLTLSELPDES